MIAIKILISGVLSVAVTTASIGFRQNGLKPAALIDTQDTDRQDTVPRKSYLFTLPDSAGRLVRASDFKGKLVVLEFWFTGCVPCMALAKTMEPVIEYFDRNEQVVFVNINLDTDKEQWLHSVINGGLLRRQHIDYVHPGTISLATYPYGFQHPIARYYGLTGAPVLIIVGKEGEILNRNPPRPRLTKPETIDEFIMLVESYLVSTEDSRPSIP